MTRMSKPGRPHVSGVMAAVSPPFVEATVHAACEKILKVTERVYRALASPERTTDGRETRTCELESDTREV